MDGYEATRRIKSSLKGQTTIIVALTASAFEEDRKLILSVGCDDMVRKPFRNDEIFDKLAKHLGVHFIYDDQPIQPAAGASTAIQDVFSPVSLAALPSSWLTELRQATIKADINLILSLVDQIREHNGALADMLVSLANDFEYKKILAVVERAGERL